MQLALQHSAEGNKDDERRLLHAAYLATLDKPPQDGNSIFWLQSPILRQMMQDLGPSSVEELFPATQDATRAVAVELLVTRYTDAEQFDNAISWLRQAPHDGWFPFAPAIRLMGKLPPNRINDRRAIFAEMYSFCDGKAASPYLLAAAIEKFWRDLPRTDVLTAINRILDLASRPQPIVLKQPVPSAWEEYRSKFLPILRELDPARAEQLERQIEPPKEPAPPMPQPRAQSGLSLPIPRELQTTPPDHVHSTPVTPSVLPAPKKPRVVNGCLVSEPWCRQNRIENALRAASDHLKKHETDFAKVSIRRGFRLVEGELQYDSDPADPNQAPKSMWPSTVNAQAFAVLASNISADYALSSLSRVRDPEIQLMARVLLARMWLGARPKFEIPNVLNNQERGCECISYYMYMPRELFKWAY